MQNYGRKLNVKDIEGFIGMLDDVGAHEGIISCPLGFTPAAERRARPSRIALVDLSLDEAERLEWCTVARKALPWDEYCHLDMADAYHAFASSEGIEGWIEKIEVVPFEEWKALLHDFVEMDQAKGAKLLTSVVQSHPDDAWRFNAAGTLSEHGLLEQELRDFIVRSELDPEAREALRNLPCRT